MTDTITRAARLEFLIGAAQHVQTHPRGRVCAVEGCRTVLSMYNPADRCELHAERESDHDITRCGHRFRICLKCGVMSEVRGRPSKRCGRCGTTWGEGT